MAIIFFSKCLKFDIDLRNRTKKSEIFFFLKISPFESRTINSQNLEQDNYHWQSMCFEKARSFNISLIEVFSKSRSPRVMKKYDESGVIQIFQEFGTL